MKFTDIYISKENKFTVGIEEETGKYFLSIPVSNALVDYEEYYEITETMFNSYLDKENELFMFAEKCRRRENDMHLLIKPGKNRGVPVV